MVMKDKHIETFTQENPDDVRFHRCKDITLFCVSLVLLLSAFGFCAYILLSHRFSADDKKWAMAIASSIIMGLLAYLTGKNIK
jgi:hypothetical protein